MATTPRCRRRFENAALAAAANLSVLAIGSLALAEDAEDVAAGTEGYPPCEVTPDERAMAAAKGAFEAGNAAFNEADYPRAITYWEDAYRRDCTAHPMLKNLARAYELDGQYRRAIVALETYLERQPNSGDASSITLRIEALQKRLAEEPSRDAPVEASPVPPAPPPPEAEPPPPEPEMERSPVPLYVAGAGAVVGIVGGVLSFRARSTIEEIREECPDEGSTCARGLEGNDARDDAVLWSIVGGAGGAIAAGGLVWYFVQDERPAHGGLILQLSPAHAGISYSGSFDF